ncbi:MAG: glycosyltransferase family 9 protein [Gemmatimonadota bacterium]
MIQTAFLGDAVLTTPLIAELAKRCPVDVVTTPAAGAVLANNPAIRSLITYDKHGADGGVGGFLRLASRLRRAKYDAAYLAQQSVRSGALALASGARTRVGFATSAGRLFYTNRVEYRRDVHHAARLLGLVDANGAGDARPRLFPGIAERAAVDRLLSLHESASEAPLVALAPGSIWATKRWPYYPDLARELGHEARIVVLGSADDQALAKEVARAGGANAINSAGALSLLASAELIRRCRLIVTNDSAPQHLASAMGTPTLTLFGPTAPLFGFGPLAPSSQAAGVEDLSCRPCNPHGPHKCPLGHWRCMLELSPAQVTQRVRDILSAP